MAIQRVRRPFSGGPPKLAAVATHSGAGARDPGSRRDRP
jgi:hypothetical protein